MQTTKTTPYHCAELRRSVPVLQRIEWVSGIGQDDAEPADPRKRTFPSS